jgi:hypothetical protein
MAIKYEADETIPRQNNTAPTLWIACARGHQSRDPEATREFRTAAAIWRDLAEMAERYRW